MTTQRILNLTCLGLSLFTASCSGSPTADRKLIPGQPAYEGHGFGSGNVVDSTTTSTATAATPAEVTAPEDTTGRTGHGFGSGN